jgi:formylglycine-generating enzyme required for sulfatase activity
MTALGRADVVRALRAADHADEARIVELLGYQPSAAPRRRPEPEVAGLIGGGGPSESHREQPEIRASPIASTPFWRATIHALRDPESQRPQAAARPSPSNPPTEPPIFHVLAPVRDLGPRLRPAVTARRPVGGVDCDRVVETLGQGRPIQPVPRETARRLTPFLSVILDRSNRLIPFWDDQDLVRAVLENAFPSDRLAFSVFHEALDEPTFLDAGAAGLPFTPPTGGGAVLVLGDLGGLARDGGEAASIWRGLGRRILAAGCAPAALTPCPLGRIPRSLADDWRLVPWERPGAEVSTEEHALGEAADRLLALASPAIRLEPGLLRALRRALPARLADAGTESDVWTHSAVESQSPHGASLHRDAAEAFRARFATFEDDLQARALEIQKTWRHGLPAEIWHEEVINLPAVCAQNLPDPGDLAAAREFFSFLHSQPGAVTGRPEDVMNWLERAGARATKDALGREPELARAVESVRLRRATSMPRGAYDPILVAADPAIPPAGLAYDIRQVSGGLVALPSAPTDPPGPGSLIGVVRSANRLIRLDAADAFWPAGRAPAWADAWGEDQHGHWASFRIGDVAQRLRWIPPGEFWMGSLEDEPGRWANEAPVHQVRFASGFWMFDTPCTQALWSAVMGDNPSWFKSPERPVECVSFAHAVAFIERLNHRVPGLALSLPSEAQWEYACRAGTTTATYAGAMTILGERNAPVLDAIAWYGGNSGVGFDLDNGQFCGDWIETQYPQSIAGTRPVKLKSSNAWGLHDMLGNVEEWCADIWHDDYNGAPDDGSAWTVDAGGDGRRVVRGGNWLEIARGVRSADRNCHDPNGGDNLLGFRCVLGEDQAARIDDHTWLRPGGQAAPLPRADRLTLTTDREILTLVRETRPPWASGMGRDRFGLHADFTVPGTEVTQRMRWIPPGRFAMGAPDDESGRWSAEGPVHDVTLAAGFWLFDTPCTQALWAAVMRDAAGDKARVAELVGKRGRWPSLEAMVNPSRFASPTRPVEQVSHDDLWVFIEMLNGLIPGLDLTLPSEAEWEYACRAGTETATYAGAMEILGANNAPAFDPIAWYGGNSGVGFELDNGYDSSGWDDKQFDHERAGTRPVAMKAPNAWGLYDMLGNVWEWCADTWNGSYDGAPADGSAWLNSGPGGEARRVLRGGSWFNDAQNIRAAYRFGLDPEPRSDILGFRCARVQSDSERERRAGRSKPGERSEQAATMRPKRRGLSSILQPRKGAPKAPKF